ncbi:hypothetical protein N7516_003497 [Penicillium verrucosum]|uniref:uncharacterized protein n=1 Tax=Penicillium verrucosum TaxID=60171 RepID=UPI0025452337|nr:uncharacterized protein N7516_003497 [Penicillium verrucosum]KAJ5943329.1 hypothetical protein N7516_003497 [Penicillium verrucosum]
MPRFTLYLHIACAFMTVWYAAQTLIIAQRYAPLAALWGSTRGGCMGPGIRFDFCAVCDSLVFCVGVLTSIIRMVCMIVALQHSDDTVYYVSVAMCRHPPLSIPVLQALFGV